MSKELKRKTISGWQREVHGLACEKGWYDDPAGVPAWIALMHSELSEAFEHWRKRGEESWTCDDGKPDGFAVELADCVIRILDTCEYLGIDLEDAMARKHEYNKTRPYKHGGKRC